MTFIPRSRIQRRQSRLNGWFSNTLPTSKYPNTYSDLPVDMDDWSCEQFKVYYERNKAIIGKSAALQMIQIDAGNLSMTSNLMSWCKYDCSFVDFWEKEGLEVGNIFSKAYCALENIPDAVGGVTGTVSNVADFFDDLTKSKLLIIGLIGGGAYLYYRHKQKKK